MIDRGGLRKRALEITGLSTIALTGCARGPAAGDLAGWNVLLVTIDTLRADHVGFAGYEGAETPVMDALAEHGIVFENAVATAPVTLPSHASILTGLYPPAHGALDNGLYSLPDDVLSLPGHLRNHGYRTAAVIGAYVVKSRFGLDSGFDFYEDRLVKPRSKGQAYRERAAGDVTAVAVDWLGQRDPGAPFFLWVHYFDPHAPYLPPEPYKTRFPARPYDGEIAYTDASLGRLLEAVDRIGERERTLIVVTADHGEAFGDGGEATHGLLLRGSTLRVPLVVAAPGGLPEGRRVEGVVSSVDVAPTILDLLGLPGLPERHGASLVEAMARGRSEGRHAYSETRLPRDEFGWSMLAGVRNDRWAWVRAPRPELYDLESDVGETTSLHEERPELADRLDSIVERILTGGRESVVRSTLTEEQIEALRSLGYVFSAERPPASGEDPKDMMSVQQELNLLQNFLERGDAEAVLTGTEALLERTHGNREVLLLRAQAFWRLDRREEATELYRRSLAAGGSLEVDGTLLAMGLAATGRAAEAEALLRKFEEAEPDFPQHPFNLGNLLIEIGRIEDAVSAYERAYALDPENTRALVNLAFARSRVAGDTEYVARTISLIDRAIELAVDDRPALAKSRIFGNLGRVEEGLAVLRELARRPRLRGVEREEVSQAMRDLQAR